MEDLLNNQENIRFSGAGASNKNGAEERAIKKLVTTSRTMLMHAAIIHPEETLYTDIWTMAMDYNVWINNKIPAMKYGLSGI